MNEQNSKPARELLFLQGLQASLAYWKEAGLYSRMLQLYEVYSKNFNKVYIRTYDGRRFDDLPPRVEHIPFLRIPLGKYLYFFCAGFLGYKPVDYVEVPDVTAILPALVYKIRGARLFYYHVQDLSKVYIENRKPFLALISNIMQILAFKIADTIAVTTKTLGDEVRKHASHDKVYLLPNYVNVEQFRKNQTAKISNLLVFVGRLHPEKNLHMLLDVMKQLPQYRLWIIGTGPLRDKLINYKNRAKLENVEFLKMIPHDELPDYLNRAEAFILVSHAEGHPKALIEAMACGLPSIGTNVEGIKDVITDGETGILCAKDVDSIRDGIERLFEDRERMAEMGRKARAFALENFSMRKVVERRIKMIKGELDSIEPLFSGDSDRLPTARVCFFAPAAYPLLSQCNTPLIGGAEVQQMLLAKELVRKGFEVSFIVYDHGQKRAEVIDGITAYKIFPPEYVVKGIISILKATRAVWFALRKADADIYHQRSDNMAASALALFCVLKRKKYVYSTGSNKTVDGTYIKSVGFLLANLFRFAIKKADSVVVQTKYQIDSLKKTFGRDGVMIPSGHPIPERRPNKEKPPIVLWVGTISEPKQPQLFLRLAQSIPGARFQMISAPSQATPELYKLTRDSATEIPNLEFLGFIPYHRVWQYFDRASILVNTSIVEGFPNTFLQAWANYAPVVSLNVDPDEIICEHELGFHSRSFEQLVSDIKLLLANHRLREEMGMNGRQYVEREHNIKRTADEYERLFQQLYHEAR